MPSPRRSPARRVTAYSASAQAAQAGARATASRCSAAAASAWSPSRCCARRACKNIVGLRHRRREARRGAESWARRKPSTRARPTPRSSCKASPPRSTSSACPPPPRSASPRCARVDATCCAACYGGELAHPLPPIAQRAIGIVGSYVGSLQELKEVVALAKKRKLKPMPVETRPADEANAALEDLKAGRVVGRDRARLRIRGRLSAVKYRARYDDPILLEQSLRLAAQAAARGERRRDLAAARRAGRPADARRRRQRGRRDPRHRDHAHAGRAGLERHRLRRLRHRLGRQASCTA